jgi:hypothetical protein
VNPPGAAEGVKMRSKYFIPLIAAVLALAATSCCAGEPVSPVEYQPVTVAELIANTSAYDNQHVVVSGEFVDFTQRPPPECYPNPGCGFPQQLDIYAPYRSTWGIADGSDEIGVLVIYNVGTLVHTLPDYEEGETVTIRGKALATTVSDYCNSMLRYRSLYISVDADDIDITIED